MKALLKSQSILPQALLGAPTMLQNDLLDWVPRFPNSHTASFLLNPESVMQVTEDGFIIRELNSLFAPLSVDFPLSGSVVIRNVRENLACQITFTAECEDHDVLGSGQLLLWSLKKPLNQGRWLIVISNYPDGLRVKLGHGFVASEWIHAPLNDDNQGMKLVEPWPGTTLPSIQQMTIDLRKSLNLFKVSDQSLTRL